MRQPKIGTYGKLRPTGVDNSGAEVLSRLAGVVDQAGDLAFSLGAEKREKEGLMEGAQVDISQPIQLKEESLSIKDKAYNKAAITAYRSQMSLDTREALDRLEGENAFDPEGFKKKAEAYRAGMTSGMPEELKILVEDDFNIDSSNRLSRINKNFDKDQKEKQTAIVAEDIETSTDELLNAVRNGDKTSAAKIREDLNQTITSAVESRLIDRVKAKSLREQLEESEAEQKVLGEVDSVIFNEDLSIEEKIAKAQGFLEQLQQTEVKGLDPMQRDKLANVVGARFRGLQSQLEQQKKQQDIATQKLIGNLKLSASRAVDMAKVGEESDLSSIVEETEKLHSTGKITSNERVSLLKNVQTARDEINKITIEDRKILARMSGDPSIVTSQTAVDSFYQREVKNDIDMLGPEMGAIAKANFIKSSRFVPKQIQAELQTQLVSGDSELIRQASDLIDRVDEVPGIGPIVSKEQRAFAELVNQFSPSMEQEQAVKLARELTDPSNKARVDAKAQEIKDERMNEDYSSEVESEFSSFLGGDYLTSVNRSHVELEYKELFENFFKAGMPRDAAKSKALQLLRKDWKESEFGFMRNPPEDYYSVAGNTDYIREQLYKEVIAGSIGLDFTKENLILFSDEKTQREAAQGQPSYQMLVLTDDGVLERVFLDDDEGNPSNRWMPDMKAEEKRQLKENEEGAMNVRKGAKSGDISKQKRRSGMIF